MRTPSEVPVVSEADYFVCAELERLKAMEEAQAATSDEARLEAALIVTNLYSRQFDHVSSDVMPGLRELAEEDPRQAEEILEWLQAWKSQAEASFDQWAAFLAQLVEKLGRTRAEQIADGTAAARLEAVTETAVEHLLDRARVAGIAPAEIVSGAAASSPDAKICPDCAEEVRAAARRCRYCGYQFDEVSPSP